MKNALKIAATTSSLVVGASATIYIAPPDIDTYKQKADQAFYDLYQNEHSAIAKGANKELKDYVNSIKTKNKLFDGETITKVAQGYSQGKMLKINSEYKLKVFGDTYKIVVTDLGDLKIIPLNSKTKKFVKANTMITRTDSDAIQLSSPQCIKKGTKKVGKSTYSVCEEYQRKAAEATFNVISGEMIERIGTQTTPSVCKYIAKGKSSYFSCKPNDSAWTSSNLEKVVTRVIDIQKIITEKSTKKGMMQRFFDIPNIISDNMSKFRTMPVFDFPSLPSNIDTSKFKFDFDKFKNRRGFNNSKFRTMPVLNPSSNVSGSKFKTMPKLNSFNNSSRTTPVLKSKTPNSFNGRVAVKKPFSK